MRAVSAGDILISMNIEDLFQSPGRQIADFFKAQTLLYRHDPSLQDYFMELQLAKFTGTPVCSHELPPPRRLFASAIRGADKVSRFRSREVLKCDVIICPNQHFGRQTETRFFIRTVLGVAQTGAKILCLLPNDAPCRKELYDRLEADGRAGQVEFLDPANSSNQIEARLRKRVARARGREAFAETVRILEPFGLSPRRDVIFNFERRAYAIDAWERLATWIDFDAAIVRCHWFAVSSSICRTAMKRAKPVMTFQQGVICDTLDVPITAAKYVTFGQPSARFMARANRAFFDAARKPELPVEYVNGGCLIDTIIDLPDQFDRQSLLMVDVPTPQRDFYGVECQSSALLELAERLLAADLPLRRIVIRPHPFWSDLDFEACRRLIREHPMRCELSHPAWSLEDDLRRSSIAIGIFSGVLTVASACGLPTYFLQTEQGFSSGDLECFSPGQTLLSDATFSEIARILSDRKAYAAARALALRNAREYYTKGANLNLDAAFFERHLLGNPPSSKRPEEVR